MSFHWSAVKEAFGVGVFFLGELKFSEGGGAGGAFKDTQMIKKPNNQYL